MANGYYSIRYFPFAIRPSQKNVGCAKALLRRAHHLFTVVRWARFALPTLQCLCRRIAKQAWASLRIRVEGLVRGHDMDGDQAAQAEQRYRGEKIAGGEIADGCKCAEPRHDRRPRGGEDAHDDIVPG